MRLPDASVMDTPSRLDTAALAEDHRRVLNEAFSKFAQTAKKTLTEAITIVRHNSIVLMWTNGGFEARWIQQQLTTSWWANS